MKHLKRLTRIAMTTAAAALFMSAGNTAHAQLYKDLHIGNVAVGGTGVFNTILESNERPYNTTAAGGTTSIYNQRQDTTWSAGFVGSVQMVPKSWLGLQLNYSYTRYQERYSQLSRFTPTGSTVSNLATRSVQVPTDAHEATAGYLIHPKHIAFKPYVAIGGGAIDFNPEGGLTQFQTSTYSHQWRGAGYLETGFDIPTHNKHFAFRVSGRSLYYRSPNYGDSSISTRSWRVTTQPAISAVYKF
ncbi:hypothetical protein ACFQBQ_08480 [Granulicella cerasi]|uniref:Outer membrane protein beta-barrel domain-containing protein n=1 Tax=Granulicella cerasi TaxID=741063 RepID=A0ABW1Z884_9BACT|nr:hypothetical protein [Granulicella cerasi]